MVCPGCGGKTRVVDSRKRQDSVKRMRECKTCRMHFTTIELDMDYYKSLKEEGEKSHV